MKINWKVRFKQPTFIISFAVLAISFIYKMLGLFEVVPSVSEEEVTQLVLIVVDILAGIGIVQDPTTKGVTDSERAMQFEKPRDDRSLL